MWINQGKVCIPEFLNNQGIDSCPQCELRPCKSICRLRKACVDCDHQLKCNLCIKPNHSLCSNDSGDSSFAHELSRG